MHFFSGDITSLIIDNYGKQLFAVRYYGALGESENNAGLKIVIKNKDVLAAKKRVDANGKRPVWPRKMI